MEPDQGASFEFDGVVFFDGEGVGGGTGPLVLDVVVVFWDDFNSWGHEEGWVESDTELPDQVDLSGFQVFQEVGGAWFGHGTQISDELVFSHTDTVINDF